MISEQSVVYAGDFAKLSLILNQIFTYCYSLTFGSSLFGRYGRIKASGGKSSSFTHHLTLDCTQHMSSTCSQHFKDKDCGPPSLVALKAQD